MDRVSRPLLGVLVATVLVFALWIVALKPSNSSTSANGTGGGLGQYQGAINAAKNVQTVVNRGDAAAAGSTTPAATPTPTSTPTTSAAPASTPAATKTSSAGGHAPTTSAAHSTPAAAIATPAASTKAPATATPAASTKAAAAPTPAASTKAPATATGREQAVIGALRAGKVLALVFYNPGAADDLAVSQELRSIPSDHGRIFRLAIPISELSNYAAVTNQVPVSISPTLVFIDRGHYATTIVGYASRFEIAQRIADALAVK